MLKFYGTALQGNGEFEPRNLPVVLHMYIAVWRAHTTIATNSSNEGYFFCYLRGSHLFFDLRNANFVFVQYSTCMRGGHFAVDMGGGHIVF